jgi:Ca2+-binding EF-hand superfamily protein
LIQTSRLLSAHGANHVPLSQVIDGDKDGFITVVDLTKYVETIGEAATPATIETAIREADLDGDGKLSVYDFAAVVQNLGL